MKTFFIVLLLSCASFAQINNGGGGASSSVRSCEVHLSPVASETLSCFNAFGSTLTVTAVRCTADAGSPTVQPQVTGGASTSILSSALTCPVGSWGTGTLNGSPTLTNGSSIDVNVGSASSATYVRVVVVMQ